MSIFIEEEKKTWIMIWKKMKSEWMFFVGLFGICILFCIKNGFRVEIPLACLALYLCFIIGAKAKINK